MMVDDLPEIWNELMMKYLGIQPSIDTLGVLQDSHWSGERSGYFPSYTLGAMYACQFYKTLLNEQPGIERNISEGHFAPIKNWLNGRYTARADCIHRRSLFSASGESLNPDHFINYLKHKYSEIYDLV